jgi:hypothetical protein
MFLKRISLTLLIPLAAAALMTIPLWAGNVATPTGGGTTTFTLYDGALGGRPDQQGIPYANIPLGSATHTFANGLTTLDSTAFNGIYAGYLMEPTTVMTVPVMTRTEGYTITFSVQIESEAHANNDRAGFSIIALSSDVKGIELGFWVDEIWAQHDDTTGALFTHAEGVTITTTALTTYTLLIMTDTYTLAASGSPILTGPLRDYTNFTGPIDPYETPNFIFLGDDTTSAQAGIKFRYLAVTVLTPPEPTATATSTATATATSTATATATSTPTPTPTAVATDTPTSTPGLTNTPTATPIISDTPTPTSTPPAKPELLYLPFVRR